ncbi:triose-phosphate isomerase [Pelagibius litoralis]|uniref:Triosephosphate isomerase n=1 Tax=Pelagibius litoralis TaxID=374515 RepID=A0A967C9Z8_9PROT|nr:triose-phosphate isomerase [Pelagibius litoralis]NIA67333.1 triose-phosphate isomerase [Pelagibius litoralis]
MKPLIAGNWKMNGLLADATALAEDLKARAAAGGLACELLVCPPYPHIGPVADILSESGVQVGGQDCHNAGSGAHTGDISGAMLRDMGCSHVILGHSERRADHGENDAVVRAKAEAALAAGLIPIVCVGETAAERSAGQALAVIARQVKGSVPVGMAAERLVVAYEPVWAIGTGQTATPGDVAEAHTEIRRVLVGLVGEGAEQVRILYGGSVKPANARELMAQHNVGGALVGGASLKAEDFWAIATSCP